MIETAIEKTTIFSILVKELKKDGYTDRQIFEKVNKALSEDDSFNERSQKGLFYRVTETLREIGIPANLSGYKYVRDAIIMAIEDPSCMSSITKVLYPSIASKYDGTSSNVERAIRHAIAKAWDKEDCSARKTYFGNTISSKSKPTNSQFVAVIAEAVQLRS